jgi:hypothetical protein
MSSQNGERRDIQADRQEFDRVCLTPDWPSYADFVGEALPHYLDRCGEAEAALEAAIAYLVQSENCSFGYRIAHHLFVGDCRPLNCEKSKHDCWHEALAEQGKKAAHV